MDENVKGQLYSLGALVCISIILCVMMYSMNPARISFEVGNITHGLVRLPYDEAEWTRSVNQRTCDMIRSNGPSCVKYNIDDLEDCVDDGWHVEGRSFLVLGTSYHSYVCKDLGQVRKTCVEWGEMNFPDYC